MRCPSKRRRGETSTLPLDGCAPDCRSTNLTIGGIAVVAGVAPPHEKFLEMFDKRIARVARYRQILRTFPLDVRAPQWVDAEGFDIHRHVKRIALGGSGDDAALFEFVADRMAERLDRERPLWQCWVIEGIAHDRWAIFLQVHHCIGDGITVTHLLADLCDEGDCDSYTDDVCAGRSSDTDRARKALLRNPLRWPNALWGATTGAARAIVRTSQGSVDVAAGLAVPAAHSSLNGPITRQRAYAPARVYLDDVAMVCRAFDVSINDVALAAITDAYRTVLMSRGEKPDARTLRTLVPVTVKRRSDVDRLDNRVSLMLPYLPVDLADPVERLRTVHARLSEAKQGGQRDAGRTAVAIANVVPWAVSAWTMRALLRLPQKGIVALATNVPGPRRRLHILGRDVQQLLPVPPIALQLRTVIAILSYADTLTFGVSGDLESGPDVEQLAAEIERGVARLVGRCTRTEPSGR